jgi:hypothetical protein
MGGSPSAQRTHGPRPTPRELQKDGHTLAAYPRYHGWAQPGLAVGHRNRKKYSTWADGSNKGNEAVLCRDDAVVLFLSWRWHAMVLGM